MTASSRLIAAIAKESAARISRRTVKDLQRMTDVLSGDDSGLINIWDEICVQRQGEESFYWHVYDQTVRSLVAANLDVVPTTELQAMWLQTDEGDEWLDDSDGHRSDIPWGREDVVEYITHEIYDLADNWSNGRIRQFLEQDYRDHD